MTEIFRNSGDFIWYFIYITSAFHENKNEGPEIYRAFISDLPERPILPTNQERKL